MSMDSSRERVTAWIERWSNHPQIGDQIKSLNAVQVIDKKPRLPGSVAILSQHKEKESKIKSVFLRKVWRDSRSELFNALDLTFDGTSKSKDIRVALLFFRGERT